MELFPPVMNMARFLALNLGEHTEIAIYTTSAGPKFPVFTTPDLRNVRIYREGGAASGRAWPVRVARYVWFHLFGFIHCLWNRPAHIIYLDSISALVPVLLNAVFRGKVPLYIHYHEYMSPQDYSISSSLNYIHRMEKQVYDSAKWVSHTNMDRMRLFLADIGKQSGGRQFRIMPNYPPRSWAGEHRKHAFQPGKVLRLVYSGAVDLNTMFLREVITWVDRQNGKCELSILSNQNTKEISRYLEQHQIRHVFLHDPVPYHKLPEVLKLNDVGLILYTDYYVNFVYNAPNKLFEYLSVGLDVWYPITMKGIHEYRQNAQHPLVVSVDFSKLEGVPFEAMMPDKHLEFKETAFHAEDVYIELLECVKDNSKES